ncbi:hypothetical protein SAMN05192558_103443 [Actinokineospora alba]|uniref:Cold shock protein, CspA family n=2 Tax=Actinokineospora alba TaxID=504798 RepID=A0A1H0KE08_9PSEU|nr:hypothetical protein C8E96_3500 [Actinokineospora alba]SDH89353.1 hypothetical protein SAMN05421871_102606 [Actinokineospora alba]SDO54050.1 hypothetical protein SAMN05192558_103443 [Actinokineospora alba]
MDHMATANERVHRGKVLQWNEEDGWGIIESPTIDSPIWTHFSTIDPADPNTSPGGYRRLRVNEAVDVTVERAEQDGYHWRATWVKGAQETAS